MGIRKKGRSSSPQAAAPKMASGIDFEALVEAIISAHQQLQFQATKAVNVALTIRNWLIGCRIAEFEMKGRDRAAYGAQLLEKLSQKLQDRGIPRVEERELRRYRQLYLLYPRIRESLTPELRGRLASPAGLRIRESSTPESGIPPRELIQRISFTHLVELIQIGDPLKRAFYEVECFRGKRMTFDGLSRS